MAKYFFINRESEKCYPIDVAIDLFLETNPIAEEIELFRARRIVASDSFYCKFFGEILEKGVCGRFCDGYRPKTKVSGMCGYNGYTYELGEKVTISIHNDRAHPNLEWRDIEGYEGKYQVSSCGLVKKLGHYNKRKLWSWPKLKKPNTNTNGYHQVAIFENGKTNLLLVHRLVYQAFNGPLKPNMDIDHINCVRKDNRAINLRQVSRRENLTNRSDKRTSQYVGVCKLSGKKNWIATITIKGKQYYLGEYQTEEEASRAYQKRLKSIAM